ncbi:MAG: tetratricopeptide repeat protein [Verrucomicrobiota bacterium]|jgi:tetratricopeptide (TPR) repeat protein|nr:tetratricopeptide repeat protein [Verrucomicrobiota bacterium]
MGTRQKLNITCLLAVLSLMGGAGCKPPGARALFKGENLLQSDKPKEAVIQFEQATQYLPKEWRAWNFLGMARHRAGDLEGADQAYQKAVELVGKRRYSSSHPSFVLEFNIGRLCLDRKRPLEALGHLSTFAEQDQSFPACYWLAETYRANGHHEHAAEMLNRALNSRSDSAVAWNRLGAVQLELGRVTSAIASFEKALKYRKDFAEAQRNLAITYHHYAPKELENSEELALQAFKDYLALEPADADAVQRIADALESKLYPEHSVFEPVGTNQLADANTNTTTIPAIIPELPLKPLVESNIIAQVQFPGTNGASAIVIRQNARLASGVVTNVVASSKPSPPEKNVTIMPTIPPTPSQKPLVPAAKKETPPEKAAKVSSTAILPKKILPKVPNVPGIVRYQYVLPARPPVGDNEKARKVFDKAYHHHKLNQLNEAIAGYQEALVLDPAFQQAHLNSAIAYQAKGEFKKALSSYELALAINPLSKISRYGFAQSLHREEFYVDAAREFEKLIKVHEAYLPGHLELAIIYAGKLQLPNRAKMHYRRVLELNPQHSEAPVIRDWLLANNRP